MKHCNVLAMGTTRPWLAWHWSWGTSIKRTFPMTSKDWSDAHHPNTSTRELPPKKIGGDRLSLAGLRRSCQSTDHRHEQYNLEGDYLRLSSSRSNAGKCRRARSAS